MQQVDLKQLGTFQLLVLMTIANLKDEAYGQNIASTLREKISKLSDPQVTIALKRLRERGLIRVKTIIHTGSRGRPRIVYERSLSGDKALCDVLNLIKFYEATMERKE